MDKLEKVIQAFENCTDPEMYDYDDETCVDCIRAGGCPWDDCQERDSKLIDFPLSLAMAALELLKAQEARLLTLGELKAYLLIDENGKFPEGYGWEELAQRAPVYIEPRNPTPGVLYWWTAERLRGWASESYFQNRYGTIRRAWTSRPTEEQRKAAAWDG